jgi:ATP phosphoribosyltransferase regulatory subunit
MRDLLPEEAAQQRALARALLERFDLFGYRLVTPPVFELANVVERGLGEAAVAEVLRFIEPESGEVAVLRPDLTPQIARIVATRLRALPAPYRLAYEGAVVRRRGGRAKKHRQIPQVGVELCGVAEDSGDLELLEVAASALEAAGLARFMLDVSDAGIVRGLLDGVPDERAAAVTLALATKDESALSECVVGLPHAAALRALPRLNGGRACLEEAVEVVKDSEAATAAARRLLALFDAAAARGLAPFLSADAGEVRGFAYYTGLTFSIYAEGPGEPIGAGGRYDELLSRFGAPLPAVGFGLDLDALASALRAAGVAAASAAGVVCVGSAGDGRLAALRARGIRAVAVGTHDAALAYARAWGFRAVWSGARVLDARAASEADDARVVDLDGDADRVTALVAGVLQALARGA